MLLIYRIKLMYWDVVVVPPRWVVQSNTGQPGQQWGMIILFSSSDNLKLFAIFVLNFNYYHNFRLPPCLPPVVGRGRASAPQNQLSSTTTTTIEYNYWSSSLIDGYICIQIYTIKDIMMNIQIWILHRCKITFWSVPFIYPDLQSINDCFLFWKNKKRRKRSNNIK